MDFNGAACVGDLNVFLNGVINVEWFCAEVVIDLAPLGTDVDWRLTLSISDGEPLAPGTGSWKNEIKTYITLYNTAL